MKCPLRHQGKADETLIYKTEFDLCYQFKCAWWLEEKNCCSIKAIGREASIIARAINDIASKMRLGEWK